MTRVAHGAYTKNTAKAMRMADERAEEEDDESESESDRSGDRATRDDAENDRGDTDADEDEDEDEDADEDEEDELEALDGEIADAGRGKRSRAKRNRYVDDVAEDDEDEDEDEDGGAAKKKKKKRRGAAAFIDDEAEADDSEEDEEDDGDEDEALDEEEREALRRDMDTRLHARMENQGAFERMENEEELERMIKERYAQPRYADAGRGVDESVDQQALHPTVRDPKLWMVTVKLGKERETVVCLMQKSINLAKQGKPPMPIFSSICQDHLKGYIYVEAEREDHVRSALQGLRHVYHSKPIRLVPINEMVDSISVVKKEVATVKVDSWVRMRTGVYKGDLAQVVDVNYADNQCTVKLVPRIDYQHLADKESGAAKGKPKSQVRPPARMFSEAEAKRLNLSLEKGRLDRNIHDVVDILCGTTKIKDGYHMKTCSLATVKLSDTPTLDELQKFAVGDDAEGQAGEPNGALAALSRAVGARKTDLKFMTGDQVLIVEGDLRNLEGVVERVDPDGRVVVMPSHKELNELLTFKPEQLRKHFKTGSTVRVLHGKHEGVVGMVVKVERDVAHIFSTVSNEEFQVFMHDLADSEETTQRIDTIGEFALHDLAMLDGNEVGCIVRVEKDVAFVMTNAGTSDRPEIKAVKLHDLKKKLFSRNISAQDAHMDTIDQGSMVRIIDGKYKDATGTVEHIYKGTLWVRARHVQEHGGIVCIRSRNCVAHGGNKGSQVGGGLAAQMMSMQGLPPKSPAHALLASSYTSGLRGELMAAANQAPRAAPPRPFAARGRGQDPLIGQTKKIRAGVYKGYVGRIVDVTDTIVRMELQAQARTITVNREHLDVPQVAPSRDSFFAPRATSGFDAPWSRTPAHYPMTPAHGGGVTPMHGGMTPAREAAWNPQQTPAHMPSEWQPTSTAGTGWGPGTGYTPGGFGDSAALAGPTPGGYGVTPGAGYIGATPGGYGVTPGGYGVTPGGYDAPAAEVQAPAPVAAWPKDYEGPFIPGVVVRLSSGAQGYITSVGAGGSTFKVKIGTTRLRDGVEVLETVPKSAPEETVTEEELEIIKPENKTRVIVVTAAEGAARGETGQLISIDGVDGVLRLDASSDVVILDMTCLARRWHE